MAAYYTFHHIELDNVGTGKRRVLKPPGGGSSDLFGTDDNSASPRRVKNRMASNLPFGEASASEVPKSSDSTDGSSTASQTPLSNNSPTNSGNNTPRAGTPLHHQSLSFGVDQPTPSRLRGKAKGNPVTGEGYEEEVKKEETPVRRQRVPPGGYSSKLW